MVVADGESIGFGALVHEVGLDKAAGAGHVFDDDGWISRHMFAEVAGDDAGVSVESAAGTERDDKADCFTLIIVVAGSVARSR